MSHFLLLIKANYFSPSELRLAAAATSADFA